MDSFRRDITINALYYDMSVGDLVSWQGGLYDLREGLIDTIADPDVELSDDPNVAIRALRFKARYGYAFSERLDAALRAKGEDYISQIPPDSCAFHLPKLFNGGYAATSYGILKDYGIYDHLFPAAAGLGQDEAYQGYLIRALEKLDQIYAGDDRISDQLIFATLLWPVLDRGEGYEQSLTDALDRENMVCTLSEDVRKALENLLTLERDFATESARTEAMHLAERGEYADALRLLEMRVAAGDAEEEALQFWKDFEGLSPSREDDDDVSEDTPEARESGAFFDNPALNALLEENSSAIEQKGWAELRIPQSIHGISDDALSPNALEVGHKLIEAGHDAYIIGGAMRDIIMGVPCNDFDIVTSATPDE